MNEKPVSPKLVLTVTACVFGILAILAVRSFMKALTRATVAQVESEFSTCRAAFQVYRVDNEGRLPDAWEIGGWHETWLKLTTPTPYISRIPVERFQPTFRFHDVNGHPYYEFAEADRKQADRNKEYVITSLGPDGNDDSFPLDKYPNATRFIPYSFSNGLYSDGDIINESVSGRRLNPIR
ncbi:hypothetical protein K8I31_05315 [bacterium]|nr:hypothetical protein [bacterium]